MKRVSLFAGHYGSGKTNLAVNRALSLSEAGKKTLIADLDIVNPYFRTRDSETELTDAGVRIIVSEYANTNVDVPALPQQMYAIIDDKSYHCVIDVGGDDRGALALGRLSQALKREDDFEMWFVVNFYRPLTRTADSALAVMREIENASDMRFTGIINNSNLGFQTTPEHVSDTFGSARSLLEKSGLARLVTSARSDVAGELPREAGEILPIKLRFRKDWAIF